MYQCVPKAMAFLPLGKTAIYWAAMPKESTFGHVHIPAVWSESSLDAIWIAKDAKFLLAYDIGIKHGFSFIDIRHCKSRGRCWKPRPPGSVFNTFLGTWRMLIHWKTMFDCYYCLKTKKNICYILRYFLHYFVSPFHQCLANAVSTDTDARSK